MAAAAARAAAENLGYELLAPGEIRKFDSFSGEDKDWPTWSFATESAVQELGWRPQLEASRAHPGVIDEDAFGPGVYAVARNLYALLAQKTRGKAQTCARLCANTGPASGRRALTRIACGYHSAEVVAER